MIRAAVPGGWPICAAHAARLLHVRGMYITSIAAINQGVVCYVQKPVDVSLC